MRQPVINQSYLLKRRQQAGAGMIEVMIAIVISAFALLGLAGLQVSALRYQKVANYHALASQYASEMADRIRANVNGARAGGYGLPSGNYSPNPPAAPSGSCSGDQPTGCTPTQTAALDIFRWRTNLNRGMAGGWGEVSGDVTAGFTIRVFYKESAVDGASSDTPDPNCNGGAAIPSSEKNVRCFVTVMIP